MIGHLIRNLLNKLTVKQQTYVNAQQPELMCDMQQQI